MYISRTNAIECILFAIKLTSNNNFQKILTQYQLIFDSLFLQDLSTTRELYKKLDNFNFRKTLSSIKKSIIKGFPLYIVSATILDSIINTPINEIPLGVSIPHSIYMLRVNEQFHGLCIKLTDQLCKYNFIPQVNTRHNEILNISTILASYIIKYDYHIDQNSFIPVFTGHDNCVKHIQELSRNRIITNSEDRTLKIWDLKTNWCISTIKNNFTIPFETEEEGTMYHKHDGIIEIFAVLNDDRLITYSEAGWDFDYILGIWAQIGGKYEHTTIDNIEGIKCITVLPRELFITGHSNGELTIWNLNTLSIQFKIKGHTTKVTCIIVIPFSNRIISGSKNGELKVWNLHRMKLEHTLEGHTKNVYLIVPLSNNRIVSASYRDSLMICNWTTGEVLFKEEYVEVYDKRCDTLYYDRYDNSITNVIIFIDDNNDEWIISGCIGGEFTIRDPDNGEIQVSFHLLYHINTMSLLPNNQIMACLRDGYIAIIDINKQTILYLRDYESNSYKLLVSKSGKIVTGSTNGMVQFIG